MGKLLHFVILLFASGIAVSQPAPASLHKVFRDDFLIGVALQTSHLNGTNAKAAEIAVREFSSVTAENDMKWDSLQPELGRYDFSKADAHVEFARKNSLALIGHGLVWHSQTPDWVFKGKDGAEATRDELLETMKKHIDTVAGRYRGKVKGWDVVNEVISNGTEGLRDTYWRRIIGDDYIDYAFRYAKAADPHAELYYNDYGLENPEKRARAVAMLKGLLARGVPIDAVGIQGHFGLNWPDLAELDLAIQDFAEMGLKVMITELDLDVLPSKNDISPGDIDGVGDGDPRLNPFTDGLPDEVQQRLAARYADLFRVFLKHRQHISRVTIWGLDDDRSWLNHFPISNRTNHPLLFDRQLLPKPAFFSVLEIGAKEARLPNASSEPCPARAGDSIVSPDGNDAPQPSK